MSSLTRTVRSDWYSGVEREYEVTVEVALDRHTQVIDSFDDYSTCPGIPIRRADLAEHIARWRECAR